MPQTPRRQAPTALGGLLHARPQAPQWLGEVCGSTQTPEHVRLGAVQVAVHVPPEQLCPAAQARPHMPQLAVELSGASQPSTGLLLQSPKPVLQVVRHTPAVQAGVPLRAAPEGHTSPHDRQLVIVPRPTSQPLRGSVSQSAKPARQVTSQRPPTQAAEPLVPLHA